MTVEYFNILIFLYVWWLSWLALFRRQQCVVTASCPSLSLVSCIYLCYFEINKVERESENIS